MSSKIGVVGSGTMGSGIAQVAAQAGCQVVLIDTTLERSQGGLNKIEVVAEALGREGQSVRGRRDRDRRPDYGVR